MSGSAGYAGFLELLVRETLCARSDSQIELDDGKRIITFEPDEPKPFKLWTGNGVGDCVERLYEGPTLNALFSFYKKDKERRKR